MTPDNKKAVTAEERTYLILREAFGYRMLTGEVKALCLGQIKESEQAAREEGYAEYERKNKMQMLCGSHPKITSTGMGCGSEISGIDMLYRCADCGGAFHKTCLKTHFGHPDNQKADRAKERLGCAYEEGFQRGSEWMREQAAKAMAAHCEFQGCMDRCSDHWNAKEIQALPLTPPATETRNV